MNYNNLEKLDGLLNGLIDDGATAGLNIAVVTKDSKWIKTYGNRQNIPTVEKATIDTIWDLASCSKVLVTTTCILKLREEGLLDLDTKVKDLLPKLEDDSVTVLQLLNHSSGFHPDIVGYKQMTPEEMVEAVWKIKKLPENENKVVYSDVNFILLGLIVKELKGSLDGYANEIMFKPLEMANTCYNPAPELKERCASYEDMPTRGGVVRGIVHDGKGFKFSGVSGHAGVFSTIEDVTHYVEMLLNDGVYHGKRFFREDTMELLRTCTTSELNERRSVGWVISDPNYALGKKFSEHTLYHTGFSGPSILIDLDKKVACVTLANRVHPSRDNKKILAARNLIHDAVYALFE